MTDDIKKIILDGIHDDLSNDDYHALDGLSATSMKLLVDCPIKYWYQNLSGKYERKDTQALSFGKAFHAKLLEPETFDDLFITEPKVNKRTNAGKEELAQFNELNSDKTILTPADWENLDNISEYFGENVVLRDLINESATEVSFVNTPAPKPGEIPVRLRVRPDFMTDDMIGDIKTTTDASYKGFYYAIKKYKYHLQAALYLDVVSELTGRKYNHFLFVAIEKDPPYAIGLYMLSRGSGNKLLEEGKLMYERAIKTYRACKEENFWPSYNQSQAQDIN